LIITFLKIINNFFKNSVHKKLLKIDKILGLFTTRFLEIFSLFIYRN